MAFEYLEEYKTFESVEEMDLHVEQHIQHHYFNLTESERAIVFTLASRSLMYPGVSHLKAETIATTLEISTKTVYRSVKKLVDLNIIEKIPGVKLNGIKGANIYKILPFENVSSEMSERENVVEANNDAVYEDDFKNQSSNSFNLLKTSTFNNINNYLDDICSSMLCVNDYQKMLYNFMCSLPLAESIKTELHKVVLASQVDNANDFVTAKNVIFKIAMDIRNGVLTVRKTLRSVFVGAYNKALERREKKVNTNHQIIEETSKTERKVEFYNWLEERDPDADPVVIEEFRPAWLEW